MKKIFLIFAAAVVLSSFAFAGKFDLSKVVVEDYYAFLEQDGGDMIPIYDVPDGKVIFTVHTESFEVYLEKHTAEKNEAGYYWYYVRTWAYDKDGELIPGTPLGWVDGRYVKMYA